MSNPPHCIDHYFCRKHKSFQVQQVQQELADKKRIDETKLKLESVIKRRIRLEAISYALQVAYKNYF